MPPMRGMRTPFRLSAAIRRQTESSQTRRMTSLVKLTAWLCKQLDLSPKDVIRHYDVTGKACPKYFVDHEDAWKQFRKDVKKAMRKDI